MYIWQTKAYYFKSPLVERGRNWEVLGYRYPKNYPTAMAEISGEHPMFLWPAFFLPFFRQWRLHASDRPSSPVARPGLWSSLTNHSCLGPCSGMNILPKLASLSGMLNTGAESGSLFSGTPRSWCCTPGVVGYPCRPAFGRKPVHNRREWGQCTETEPG